MQYYKAARNHNLKKHMESAHEQSKPFKGKFCEDKAGIKSILKKHIETVHEGINPFEWLESFMSRFYMLLQIVYLQTQHHTHCT